MLLSRWTRGRCPLWGTAPSRVQLTKVYHVESAADTEEEGTQGDGSDSDVAMIGNNPLGSKAGNDRSEKLRSYLRGFTTEAERIKGSIYSAEECEKRWGRRLVMPERLEVLEVLPDGSVANITHVLIMASTTGMNAAEALAATTHGCDTCKKTNINFSQCILVDVVGGRRVTYCKQCYMESMKDDPDDHRACRATTEWGRRHRALGHGVQARQNR